MKDSDLPVIHRPCENLSDWSSRSLCETLEDSRVIVRTLLERFGNKDETVTKNNLLILLSLINEIQVYANRMEAALSDLERYEEMKKEGRRLKKEIKKLRKEKEGLEDE